MKRVIIIVLIVLFASTTLAFAAWKIVDLVQDDDGDASVGEAASSQAGEEADAGEAPEEGAPVKDEIEAEEDAEAAALPSGEDFAVDDPDARYVTETQRHQNFFIALAEGRVKRLDAIATDYQPVGDPNTSYLYFTLTTTDGTKSDGTMVLKRSAGYWRIAAVRQLDGDLGGGTNYPVPATFEDDLAREISEQQDFLTKVAQGELDYLVVDRVNKVSDTETILVGRVVGEEGRIERAEMHLHKDYNLWHLTGIVRLGRVQ